MNVSHLLTTLLVTCLTAWPVVSHAQGYDDDIYYNPSKAAKTTKANTRTTQTVNAGVNTGYSNTSVTGTTSYTPTPDYPSADTYTVDGGSTRDVDEYNRHSGYTVSSTANLDSALWEDNFSYTRRIERFHNPDVVVESRDGDVIDYYYNTDVTPQVTNIYVNNGPYWDWTSTYPSYSSWWNWNYGWGYNSWYWGPSLSLSWYPSWNWTWGWGYDPWYWGGYHPWYPAYRPPYAPVYPGGMAWRPNATPGASNTHRPVGTTTANNSNRRPGTVAGGSSINTANPSISRPGNMGRGRYANSSTVTNGNARPGSTTTAINTGINNSTVRPGVSTSSSDTRGRNNGLGSSTTQRRDYNTNNNSNNNFRTSNSNSTYRSSGSFGTSRSSGSFGGSSHGGSAGGRGRR